MDLDNQELELVRDAVYCRKMKAVGSFVFNKASEQLREIGVSALPEIEHVILHEVMPFCDPSLDHVSKPFFGAGDALVSHFQICEENNLIGTAAQLLRSLRGPLRIELLQCMNIVWPTRRSAIPEPLMDVIKEVRASGTDRERQVADLIIEGQQRVGKEPEDFRQELFEYLQSEQSPGSPAP